VICATLEAADFEPGSFSAAGLFDVVEHVSDDDALVRHARRVLRPGGALCMTVPAYQWLWSAEDDLAGHFRRYTLREVETLVARNGFDVRYLTYLFAPLALPMFALRSVPHRLGRRASAQVANRAARQHTPSEGLRRALAALLAPELRWVRERRRVPVGTTCLVVATAV
jgi:SAM-dependent methyltransferase